MEKEIIIKRYFECVKIGSETKKSARFAIWLINNGKNTDNGKIINKYKINLINDCLNNIV